MSLEAFKPIPGFNDYQISSWGRVYNTRTGRFLVPEVHNKGYLRVDLYDINGNRCHKKIHRLVAEAFVLNKHGKKQINHIDGNNQNNSFTNLEWVTDKENKDRRKMLIEILRKVEEVQQ